MRRHIFSPRAVSVIAGAILFITWSACGLTALSAEITRSSYPGEGRADIVVEGQIDQGDAVEFQAVVEAILGDGLRVHVVHLNSPGGSAKEALLIGEMIRLLKLDTAAPTKLIWDASCDSACFLIWAAGTGRYGDDIGIHRPSYKQAEFARLTLKAAFVKYRVVADIVKRKLMEWGIPETVVGRMMAVSSLEIEELDDASIAGLREDPAFAELVIARCGYDPYSSGAIRPVFDACSGTVLDERLDEGIVQYRSIYAPP